MQHPAQGSTSEGGSSLRIAFLGVAERAVQMRDSGTSFLKWNVLGLKNTILTPFFPIFLNNWKLAFAIRNPSVFEPWRLSFRTEAHAEIGWIEVRFDEPPHGEPLTGTRMPLLDRQFQGWIFACLSFGIDAPFAIERSGPVSVVLQSSAGEEVIGSFIVIGFDPAPLTPERIAAIKADPLAAKAVRADFGCRFCDSKSKVYAALERTPKLESEGYVWYADISDAFSCRCGKTTLDLSTVRKNFFALLGEQYSIGEGDLSLIPQYERSALRNLCIEFGKLVDADPPEEVLQKFIENNPVLLHQFPAERLFFKPAILTRFKADFGIVTPQKELVLIEIERASTRLLKKNGDQHSDLTHALGQIHSWLHEADEHRLALLDGLNVPRDMVGKIRGVVIAGRDAGNDAGHLRRLKGADLGRVSLFAYDDILAGLAALAQRIGGM